MNTRAALAACEATVRRADHDRYFANLFVAADRRALLFALYAFNHEIARAGEAAREPAMAEIRLQWWREVVQSRPGGQPLSHPVAVGLAELLNRNLVSASDLELLIDARGIGMSLLPFATLAAMEAHAQATSSALMQLAARLIDPEQDVAELTREAGIAYGLAGMLRSLPFHLAGGRQFLPADLLAEHGVFDANIPSQRYAASMKPVIIMVASAAMHHVARTRKCRIPQSIFPAVLPASLVPAYLSRLQNSDDMLRARAEISQLRRQFTYLRAAMLNRI